MMSTIPRKITWAVIGFCGALLVILTLAMIANGVALSENNNRILSIVEDCTTPGAPCYERGQRQGAEAIETINKVSVLAAACADGLDSQTVDEIQACVLDALAQEGTKLKP